MSYKYAGGWAHLNEPIMRLHAKGLKPEAIWSRLDADNVNARAHVYNGQKINIAMVEYIIKRNTGQHPPSSRMSLQTACGILARVHTSQDGSVSSATWDAFTPYSSREDYIMAWRVIRAAAKLQRENNHDT
jgi:hypothetical protein